MTEVLSEKKWIRACKVEDVPADGGAAIKIGQEQIAIFYFVRKQEWYATQNQCPHKMQMILSRGMLGDHSGEPKVACPFHKQTFSLKTGKSLSGECGNIKTYPVKVEEGFVFVDVSEVAVLESCIH